MSLRPPFKRQRRPDVVERGRPPGFVLLEALLAVAIMTGGIVVSLEALRAGARLQHTAEQRLRAIYLLEEQFALIEGLEGLEPGVSSGYFDPPDDDFRWRVEVSGAGQPEEVAAGLLLVRVEVEWPSRPHARTVHASRYLWKARETS